MIERWLAVIFGTPRSATTFLLGALVQHKDCAGTDPTRDPKPQGTNENPYINTNDIHDTRMIDELWHRFVKRNERYMCLKAPGYSLAYPYFDAIPYNCKYLHCWREPLSVANSICNHPHGQRVLDMDIISTDCPRAMLPVYEPLWNKLDDLHRINRALLRIAWHIECTDPAMMEQALTLFKDPVEPREICAYLDIAEDEDFARAYAKYEPNGLSREEWDDLMVNVVDELAGRDSLALVAPVQDKPKPKAKPKQRSSKKRQPKTTDFGFENS